MQKIRFRYQEEDNHQVEIEEGGKWKKGEKIGAFHLTQVSFTKGYIIGWTVKNPAGFYGGVLEYDPNKKSFTRRGVPVDSVSALTVQGKKLFV
jgi:hypothetical protein